MSPLFVCLFVCLSVCPGGGQGGGRGAVCPDFGFKSVLISFLNILHHKTIRNDVKNSPTQKLIPPHKPGTPSTDTATQFLFLVVRRGGLVANPPRLTTRGLSLLLIKLRAITFPLFFWLNFLGNVIGMQCLYGTWKNNHFFGTKNGTFFTVFDKKKRSPYPHFFNKK